jgi:DNA polymerase-1
MCQPTDVEKYACDEVYTIFKLYDYWQKALDEKEQKLINDIEIPLSTVLAKMEHTGVAIDVDYLKELSDYMTEKLAELEDLIFQLAGGSFNINSPKQVAEVLFDKLELKTKKKKSRSTSAEVLEELAQECHVLSVAQESEEVLAHLIAYCVQRAAVAERRILVAQLLSLVGRHAGLA